ncbi:conserved Plasmodium protein, unknown function [Plasmodium gallinaceum]|uniref:Uncharacterized protein n=1 Tax=Plasmodium gallinaceum TaxID=5849 RepID=A0A1J1GX54_PLAGA|nr:conserved Plasmodium protein, unknown function [Plasmodium gallinaceum]CRG95877.1 conserved Plasmodium protein, unknown function [Plasmodium gallinaceum]
MYNQNRRINATLKKCIEMDNLCHLYNIELMQQRERIENLKKKLHSYNKNIEAQESIFNNFIKYTDSFVNNIINFLENFNYSKNFNLFSQCARYCLIDDVDEIKLINHYNKINKINSCKNKKKKLTKLVNKCKNSNLNKNYFCVEEGKNIKKNKKKKIKSKDETKKKTLQQNENIYNLHQPYDTIEVKDLYNIYKKQRMSSGYY